MIVNSYNIEFGYELLSVVPYAYELHKKGELEGTISGVDTEALYYFSPDHKINTTERSWFNTDTARRSGLPYTVIHKPEQPKKKFPPYKKVYANEEYKFDKPTLCICNRKNKEWNVRAINFFDNDILDWLFTNLKDKYEIIYFPIALPKELQDSVEPMPAGDEELAREHGVKLFTDLREGKSWNETLLKVFANCEHYITMNGGYSIMASMFSGTNIIYSKPGEIETREIKQGSFWRWYPDINDVRTLHVPSYKELKIKVQSLYIDEDPCINILIRVSRGNYLRSCMDSIDMQTYPNINVVLICDSDRAVQFTRRYSARLLQVDKYTEHIKNVPDREYGRPFPYNKYLQEAQRCVQGYILFLDDDDMLTRSDSITVIAENVQKDSLLVWKVDFNEHGIKPSFSFGKNITLFDITGIGFCYHSDHIRQTDWSEWKRADYRTAKKLSEKLEVLWLDEVLTSLQDVPGGGSKGDKAMRVKLTYPGGRELIQCFTEQELENSKDYFKRAGICTEQVI